MIFDLIMPSFIIFVVIDRYQAELHMVHYNNKYQNMTEASNHDDGLAVLGVLVQV